MSACPSCLTEHEALRVKDANPTPSVYPPAILQCSQTGGRGSGRGGQWEVEGLYLVHLGNLQQAEYVQEREDPLQS